MVVLKWPGDGTFDQEVVGESHYQEDLRRLASGERRKQTTARLICESNNPHDSLAVRVEIGGKTIGHLSRDDARAHRVLLKSGKHEGANVELPVVIVTGQSGVCGVYLSVTEAAARSTLSFGGKAAKPVSQAIRNRLLIGLLIALALFGLGLMIDNAVIGLTGFLGLIGLGLLYRRSLRA